MNDEDIKTNFWKFLKKKAKSQIDDLGIEELIELLKNMGVEWWKMKDRYIVFDNNGIIHESSSYDDAEKEFNETEDFDGDLIMCKEICRR